MTIKELFLRIYIIAIFVAIAIVAISVVVGQANDIKTLTTRVSKVEAKMSTLKNELIMYKVQIRDMTRPFTHIIPISGGFLGIRE